MSIESKIAEILAESKAAKLEDQVMAEDVVEEISEEELKAAPKAEEPSNKKNNVDKNPQGKAMKEEADAEEEIISEEEIEEGVGDVAQKVVNGVKKVAGVATGAVGAVTGAMDGAVKGARKNYAATNEAIDVKEDVDALLNGEELSEEFKQKAATIFEAAVSARVKQEVARIEEEFEARLSEEAAKNKEGLVDQVDGYLGYVAEQWMTNNELALESGMKAEILEGFVGGLKGLFEEHYIDIPEERFDVLGTMEEQINELEEKLNEQVAANVEMKKVIAEQSRKEIVSAATEGLSDTQAEKFAGLAEELSYEDPESFAKKVATIRENYFSAKKTESTIVESVVTDEPVEVLTEEKKEHLDPRMAAFVAALNKK